MLKIGNYNELIINREVEFGFYLADGDGNEVLLPRRYVSPEMKAGDHLRVFVYTDSDDRPVATTEAPFATVGQFAFLQVKDVNSTGAFLDWGLPKDLLVPYSQQKAKMSRGGIYPVFVYLDQTTGRVVASAKIEKFLGNVYPDYQPGQKVQALVVEHTPIGFRVIVDNRHWGMVYANETYRPLEIEETVTAFVKGVRPDGKIDLSVTEPCGRRTDILSHRILQAITSADGPYTLTDRSTPEEIEAAFGCSKKDYKKALGHLYKEGLILLGKDEIVLAPKEK